MNFVIYNTKCIFELRKIILVNGWICNFKFMFGLGLNWINISYNGLVSLENFKIMFYIFFYDTYKLFVKIKKKIFIIYIKIYIHSKILIFIFHNKNIG